MIPYVNLTLLRSNPIHRKGKEIEQIFEMIIEI